MSGSELPAQAANILRVVEDRHACDSTVAESLRLLLLPVASLAQQNAPARNSTRSKGTTSSAASYPTAATARAKKQSALKTHDYEDPESYHSLRPQQRLHVATQVFNVTLKALTIAIKTSRAPRTPSPKSKVFAEATPDLSKPRLGTPIRGQTPLQQICVNQVLQSPAKSKHAKRTSQELTKDSKSLRAQAECSRIGLACLRSLQSVESLRTKFSPFQLENGMSALVAKLLTLGYDNLALGELRILKKRIEGHSLNLTRPSSKAPLEPREKLARNDTNVPKETLSDLLKYDTSHLDGSLLSLVTTSQIQVLKILVSKRHGPSVEAAVRHLRFETAYAPSNLIQQHVNAADPKTKVSAAHQLEILAQTIMGLCPSASISSDGDFKTSSYPSAQATLELQSLALQIRIRWWTLSNHRPDVNLEILSPFARYMNAFERRCKIEDSEKYCIAKSAFRGVSVALGPWGSSFQSASLAIFKILATLAGVAGRNDEAIQWAEQGLANIEVTKGTHLQRCEFLCRLATYSLRERGKTSDDSHTITCLRNAIKSIEGDLSGESTDLDELLLAVAVLRKVAFSIIQNNAKTFDRSQISNETSFLGQCVQVILISIRFLARYTGREPASNGTESKLRRYKQRKQTAKQMLPSTIASVVAVSRLSLRSDRNEWQTFDNVFQDALELSARLDADADSSREPKLAPIDSSFPWVSVSSIHWLRSIAHKTSSGEGRAFTDAVKKSVDMLENRPVEEKIQGAFLMKIEKYGSLCEKVKDYRATVKYCRKSIEFLIDTGGILNFAEAATSVAWPSAAASNSEFDQTKRILSTFPKVMLNLNKQDSESRIFFDAEWLSNHQRGLILEIQLASLFSLLLDREASSTTWAELQLLWELIMSLYNEEDFLARRLHVCTQLLHLSAVLPATLAVKSLSKMLEQAESQSHNIEIDCERSTQPFLPHLMSRMRVYRTMNERTDSEILSKTLIDWYNLAQSCSDRQVLETHVYDISGWLQQLDLISEHLYASGEESLRTVVLNLIIVILERGPFPNKCKSLASSLMDLGLHYAKIGYSGLGRLTLQKAQAFLDVPDVSSKTMLQWFVANADQTILSGNIEKCGAFIKSGTEALEVLRQSSGDTTNDRTIFAQTAADLMFIQSRLFSEQGHPERAFLFARAAVQDYQRTWASMSRRMSPSKGERPVESADEQLVAAVSELSISDEKGNSDTNSRYAILCMLKSWYLSPRLFAAILHLSRCFAHAGLFLEAQYYLDQCQKIADAVRSPSMTRTCLTLRGEFTVCSGEIEKGLTMIREVETTLSNLACDYQNVMLNASVACHYIKAHQIEAGRAACDQTMRRLHTLTVQSAPNRLLRNTSETAQANSQISGMSSSTTKKATIKKAPPKTARTIRSKTLKTPPVETNMEVSLQDEELASFDIVPLSVLKGEIMRYSIVAELKHSSLDSMTTLLDETSRLSERQRDTISQEILRSQIYLRKTVQELAVDPVLSVLPESTLCCPAVIKSPEPELLPKTPSKRCKPTKNRMAVSKDTPATKDSLEYLPLAQRCLTEVVNLAAKTSSVSLIHTISETLTRILTMLAVLPPSGSKPFISSQLMAYTIELGRQIAMERGSSSIRAECLLSGDRVTKTLPDMAEDWQPYHPQHSEFDFSTFQEDYLDIIPKSWTVLSITLGESNDEMWISRMRAGQSPFILRLPFNRENASDNDDEGLTFNEGRAEMLDIIRLANSSAHSTGDLSQKGAKKSWWDARATLDTRLKDLLTNIECIWFGGFRGIFSPKIQQPSLLARFEKSLQNILDKHLPSRQASAKGKHDDQIRLDSRILELFVGLGSPSEENDVDEQLMDLLYFIVDILQFQKERNAYDEIDFDAIVVETTDALRQYHQAAAASEEIPGHQHTILILDKNLHCFPWESMPCMDGQSVSRLPSLGCMRRRILRMREEHHGELAPESLEGLHVDPARGSYMLNPGGDLINTQATFEESLRQLPNWESFIGQSPTETEMKDCLQDKNVFLYFGHGSGGQYIRSRTIKKLDQCAVALLMGCSSGALTRAGEFEAYGTPITYMHAGCPALLSTLWDVTDKDIDRFSDKVLRTWGLLKDKAPVSTSSPVKKSVKSKGKTKVKAEDQVMEPDSRSVSLDEAVAKSRDSCILKYLNGAAPVVYGIPVFIG